jgi:hypothetical protein
MNRLTRLSAARRIDAAFAKAKEAGVYGLTPALDTMYNL